MAGHKNNVYLIGPMGSGKTAVGKQLAKDMGLQFVDSDFEIQKRTGVDIPYIFEKEGEAGFREREADVIADLCTMRSIIVATGGGAVLNPRSRERLAASGLVVYLKTDIDEQLKRTRRTGHRPLLANRNRREVLEQLSVARTPLYLEIADISFDTSGKRVKAVAMELAKLVGQNGFVPLQK
jgi:shikimate kinase